MRAHTNAVATVVIGRLDILALTMASRNHGKPVCSLNRTVEIGLQFSTIPLVEGEPMAPRDGHGER